MVGEVLKQLVHSPPPYGYCYQNRNKNKYSGISYNQQRNSK